MNEGRIFFARHGETDWNAAGRWQGQTDIPLNELGRAQARALGVRMQGEGIRAIGSSDLSRARETAAIAGEEIGLAPSFVDPAFRERAYGIFEGLTRDECIARYPKEWDVFADHPRTPPDSVESLAALTERMRGGLQRLIARSEDRLLVVSHGRAIRSLVTAVTGAEMSPLGNGGVVEVVIANGAPATARVLVA
jgi:broad specificity phosphatase PhoE